MTSRLPDLTPRDFPSKAMNSLRLSAVGIGMAAVAICLPTSNGFAQANPFAPPTGAIDTLAGGNVGNGAAGAGFVNRANAVAGGGVPEDPFAVGGAGGDPFGGGGPAASAGAIDPFAGAGVAAGQGFGGPGAPGQPPQIPLPPIPQQSRVLSGEKVYCAVTGRLLQDAQWQYIWATDLEANFYDDGTNGDPVANDDYYSNIMVREKTEVSPIAWRLMRQTKQMLRTAEQKDPLKFFGLTVATREPQSLDKEESRRIPNLVDYERKRDERYLQRWNDDHLSMYRVDPDDPEGSAFYKPYIPLPPVTPDVAAPANFTPPAYSSFALAENGVFAPAGGATPGQAPGSFDEFLGTAGGLQPGSSVTGVPANPGASSNYFSTTAIGGGAEGGSAK